MIDEKSDPGAWADHLASTGRFRTAHAGRLSDRLRSGVEAVPWVIEEVKRLEALVPPETNRAEGGVGQGSWSVFAEKVVAERDAALAESAALLREFKRLRSEYMELIYAVATKHPNETRHQTALRYIMQRESQQAHGPDKALRGEGE